MGRTIKIGLAELQKGKREIDISCKGVMIRPLAGSGSHVMGMT